MVTKPHAKKCDYEHKKKADSVCKRCGAAWAHGVRPVECKAMRHAAHADRIRTLRAMREKPNQLRYSLADLRGQVTDPIFMNAGSACNAGRDMKLKGLWWAESHIIEARANDDERQSDDVSEAEDQTGESVRFFTV